MEQKIDNSIPEGQTGVSLMKTAQIARTNSWEAPPGSNLFYGSSCASLFSSSLPVLPHDKLHNFHSAGDSSTESRTLGKDGEGEFSADDLDLQGTGIMLPDDEEELFAGIIDELEFRNFPGQVEESDDYDLFGSIGGFELDSCPKDSIIIGMEKASISDAYAENGFSRQNVPNGIGTIAREHPYGEHPSRTLFVRNINSSVEDSELRALFEPFGDIRSLYTACKHRGFVMISYYDIRSAKSAMRVLQNKPLRRRRLDIHFSIPKENPSDKDVNQGTLVIFNLDPSVSNNDLLRIFGSYGEVKEIRETPNRRHHKFIEFYDVRAAEAALWSLNKCDIAGKRIKLEPSRPGGARKNWMQQVSHDLEPHESRSFHHQGSSPVNSFSSSWIQFKNPNDNMPLQSLNKYSAGGIMNPSSRNHFPGLTTMFNSLVSNTTKVAPIGKEHKMDNYADRLFCGNSSPHEGGLHHSPSVYNNGVMASSPGSLSSLSTSSSNGFGLGVLARPQFLCGSPTSDMTHSQYFSWHSQGMEGLSFPSNERQQVLSFPHSIYHGSFVGSSSIQHHQVGSAPPDVPFKQHYSYFPEKETSFVNQSAFRNSQISQNSESIPTAMWSPGIALSGNVPENSSPRPRMLPSHRFDPTFFSNNQFPGLGSSSLEVVINQGFSLRGSQEDNKNQYCIDLDKIVTGEDTRTTLVIKNIPNKYTLKMLLAAIKENHNPYDFLYLPIDFKNKCNVGYAFINMLSPSHIISFYETFNGMKWEKFNSERVASLAYARIQGKAALCAHFENANLTNEESRCRPIILDFEGFHADDQKLFALDDGMENIDAP